MFLRRFKKKPDEPYWIEIIDPSQSIALAQQEGVYGKEDYVIQDFMGAWIVGEETCGMSLQGDRIISSKLEVGAICALIAALRSRCNVLRQTQSP